MKDQLQTIRAAAEFLGYMPAQKQFVLDACTQLEAMVGKQEPVHQFRSPHCSDWYDGIPDHHDGHGPYEVRTLYAAPVTQQPQDEVVVTWDHDRTRILAVTRQDSEGRILKVIAEAPDQQPQAAAPVAGQAIKSAEWALLSEGEPDMRQVCEALGFDPTNHHNAAKCPYCRGQQPQAEAVPPTHVPLDVVLDAERWRMLPAYFCEYQIDAMKLYRDIDAAIAAAKKEAGHE